jgi:hypothetical protein
MSQQLLPLIYQCPDLKTQKQFHSFSIAVTKYGHYVESLLLSQIHYRWQFLDIRHLQLVLPFCPHLTSLELDNCMIVDADIRFLHGYQLQHLSLAACKRLTDDGIKALALITALKSLDISQLPLITDAGVRDVFHSLPLRYLNMGGTALTSGVLKLLYCIEMIDISCCYLLDDPQLHLPLGTEIITDSLEPQSVEWIDS